MYTTRRLLLIAIVVFVLWIVAGAGNSVFSQAYGVPFTSSITYQNVGGAPATVTFKFYAQGSGSPIICPKTLNPGGALSLFVQNNCNISNNFQGSVLMEADQNIIATVAQISSNPLVKNRPLYNAAASGANKIWLATVLKNQFNTNSVFSVQNVSGSTIDINAKLYNAATPAATPIAIPRTNVPAGSTQYFDMAALTSVPTPFEASVVVEATGPVVGTVLELASTTGYAAKAFEGFTSGASKIYMSTALCKAFGTPGYEISTAYAVQNISTSSASVKVTYANGGSATKTINSNAKHSFKTCDTMGTGYSGAATIESLTGGVLLIAIGKAYKDNDPTFGTAFLGETGGASKLALPYVRYTSTPNYNSGSRQRTFLAIQNVGTSDATGVQVRYLNKNGDTVGIHVIGTIASNAKANSNASQAGSTTQLTELGNPEANPGGGYGASAIVEGNGQLVAIGRVSSIDTNTNREVSEDYNATQLP